MKNEMEICRIKRIYRLDSSGNYFDTGDRLITNTVGNSLLGENNKEQVLIPSFKPIKDKIPEIDKSELRDAKLNWFEYMRNNMPLFEKRKYKYVTIMIA